MDGGSSPLQPCVGDSVCPLLLSSLMNEQQKRLLGIPCLQLAGVGWRWGVWGQPCAIISLHVEWLDHTSARYHYHSMTVHQAMGSMLDDFNSILVCVLYKTN